MKMIKNLPTLKNRCYKKKGMTTSIMIHSGLSRLSNYEMLVLPSIVMQDNQEALLITYAWRKYTGDSYMWFVDQNYRQKLGACGLVLFLGGLETTWENWKTFQNNLKLQQAIKA
jgi:hypothetical protein